MITSVHFTLQNLLLLIALLGVALILQIAIQKLTKKIAGVFYKEDESEITRAMRKKIVKLLIFLAAVVNLVFFLYLAYTFILTERKELNPLFVNILKTYGNIIIYAFLTYVVYTLGTKFISKVLKVILHKTAFTNEALQRADLREQTLTHIISYILVVVLTIFFIYQALTSMGVNLAPVIAALGLSSLAIGFGAQNLVKDYVNGFFIILEDQYAVGDVITIDGNGGFVEKLTLRTTQLRNTHGVLITIPNSSITTVLNFTKDWARVDFTIGVDYATDVKRALVILKDELESLKKDMAEDILDAPGQEPDVLALDSFGNSSLNLRVWFKTKPLRRWIVTRKYNERVLERFNREGIVIPFPQSTLSIRDEALSKIKQSKI